MRKQSSLANQLSVARSALADGRIADAIDTLNELVRSGDAEAMFLRSQIGLGDESEEQFSTRSLFLLREASAKQHPGAAYQLSVLLEEGDAVEKDTNLAGALLNQAAVGGHPHALWRLELIRLYGGSNFAPDLVNGIRLIEEAAVKRSQGALRTLATFYEDGSFGYPQDPATAKKFRDAAEGDDVLPV